MLAKTYKSSVYLPINSAVCEVKVEKSFAMAHKETEAEGMFRAPILYREWGWRFMKIEKYDIALKAFEKSIRDSETEDLRTLLGLCTALTNFANYHDASAVASKCMEIGKPIVNSIVDTNRVLYVLR